MFAGTSKIVRAAFLILSLKHSWRIWTAFFITKVTETFDGTLETVSNRLATKACFDGLKEVWGR